MGSIYFSHTWFDFFFILYLFWLVKLNLCEISNFRALDKRIWFLQWKLLCTVNFYQVVQLTNSISEKKNSLAPVIKELRPLRQQAQVSWWSFNWLLFVLFYYKDNCSLHKGFLDVFNNLLNIILQIIFFKIKITSKITNFVLDTIHI